MIPVTGRLIGVELSTTSTLAPTTAPNISRGRRSVHLQQRGGRRLRQKLLLQLQKQQQQLPKNHYQIGPSEEESMGVRIIVYVLFGSFRVARRGAARKIERVVILFVPGYTAGLARFAPVSPGHEV